MNKIYGSCKEAVADIRDGASIMFGGFGGPPAFPQDLLFALLEQGAKELTIIGSAPAMSDATRKRRWGEYTDCSILVEHKRIKKVIAAYPFYTMLSDLGALERAYLAGEVEVEVVPHGTLVERIRAGGAGIGGFYTPTAVGTLLAEGKETRVFGGREYLLELPLNADFALIHAHKADTLGNLVYRRTARSYNHPMATAAKVTIVEAENVVTPGELEPDFIHTPAVYVDRIVQVGRRAWK